MLKKLLMLFIALGLSLSAALASAVEVNTADQASLESVKGIGPAHAKAIIDERTKNGPFRNVDDLVNRVKGIGPKSVQNLEAAGLTINGSSSPPSGRTTKGGKSAKGMAAATPAPAANPTPAAASEGKATRPKRSRRSKAASAAAASGT